LRPGPRLMKKNLQGRGLTNVEKHCSRRIMGYQEQDSDINVGATDDCVFHTYVTGKMRTGHSYTGQHGG